MAYAVRRASQGRRDGRAGVSALAQLRRLWSHAAWADDRVAGALDACDPVPDDVWREYTHLLAAEAVWLDRLMGRTPRVPVWPTLARGDAATLRATLATEYGAYLDGLTEPALAAPLTYVTSAGVPCIVPVGEILLHVMLHGQYHRGRINVMLRRSDEQPVSLDYVSFALAVPAPPRR